jgi:hypothetical protein
VAARRVKLKHADAIETGIRHLRWWCHCPA